MRPIQWILPVLLGLMLLLPACKPAATEKSNAATLEAAVQQTLGAQSAALTATQKAKPAVVLSTETLPPTQTQQPPSVTPLPSATASATPYQPPIPLVSVSVSTNCRSGPGADFELLGALRAGDVAEVVGKYPSLNYWIIKNPEKAGECWLWGEYATVVGNTALIPMFTPPPTPSTPLLVVSVDSICRSGPSKSYAALGTVNVGERATVLGRDPYSNYWLIKNPGAAGNCWVSGEFATLQGVLSRVATAVTPTSEALQSGYRCSVTDRGPKDGDNFKPGASFDAHWTLKNTGDKVWKGGEFRYGFQSGTAMHEGKDTYVLSKDVAPGEKFEITLDMLAPETRGTYSTVWNLYYGEIQICSMPVLIEVK